MPRALMLQGTGSDVGKSVLVAGLCRAAKLRGLNVRPFKPQNMSNNAAVARMPGSNKMGEIGRAQWLQALACGVEPTVHMNPVLLKPQSETGSQIVVQGKVFGAAKASAYQELKPRLMEAVMQSWEAVRFNADLLIVEGAGSPAEINLRSRDIANMGFATRANVPVVLVGDIDRGGVIASLVGTHKILADEDRAMVSGYLINKFRGDVSLFDSGIESIGAHTGWRCFGVVPWLRAASRLPAEDSVALNRYKSPGQGSLTIAVPIMGSISNFDDLDPLRAEPEVNLIFVPAGERLPENAGLVILPGSKSTIADLAEFRANGWDRDLAELRAKGAAIIGICGGYQMLGMSIKDPHGIEGNLREASALGLLDVNTVLEEEKTVRASTAHSLVFGEPLSGYEIHLGRTAGFDCEWAPIEIDGRPDGAASEDGKVFGCYLHGLFGADAFRRKLLDSLGAQAGGFDHTASVESALDEIAYELEQHLDVDALFELAR